MKLLYTDGYSRVGATYHYFLSNSVVYRLGIYFYPHYMCDAPDGCRHGFKIHEVHLSEGELPSEISELIELVEDCIRLGDCKIDLYADYRNYREMLREIRREFRQYLGAPKFRLSHKVA